MFGESVFNSGANPIHYVRPHWVSSYYRRNGTFVNGYYRGAHMQGNPVFSKFIGKNLFGDINMDIIPPLVFMGVTGALIALGINKEKHRALKDKKG